MAKKVAYFTKIDPALREALRRYKDAVGVPEAQQIDRALREWLAGRPEAWPLSQPTPKSSNRTHGTAQMARRAKTAPATKETRRRRS